MLWFITGKGTVYKGVGNIKSCLVKDSLLQLLEYYYQVINKYYSMKFERASICIIIMLKKGIVFNFEAADNPLLAILLM